MSSLSNHKTLEEVVTGGLSATLAESFPGLGQERAGWALWEAAGQAGLAGLQALVCLLLTSPVPRDGPLNLPKALFPYVFASDVLCASTKLPTQRHLEESCWSFQSSAQERVAGRRKMFCFTSGPCYLCTPALSSFCNFFPSEHTSSFLSFWYFYALAALFFWADSLGWGCWHGRTTPD